jgi:hypothetical protein
MNSKHTPGPWEIGRAYSSTNATPIRWNGENVAWVSGKDSGHKFTKEQTLANARLIAAAPELLELAMEGARLANIFSTVEQTKRFEEAIAKATTL